MIPFRVYNNIGVAEIPRAASMSVRRTLPVELSGVQTYSSADSIRGVQKYAFIRDPLERFFSGAVFLPNRYGGMPQGITSYADYVDMVLSGVQDDHWTPQADLLQGIPNLNLYPLEQIHVIWNQVMSPAGFPLLQHVNKTANTAQERTWCFDSQYRISELVQFYQADYTLRSQWLR